MKKTISFITIILMVSACTHQKQKSENYGSIHKNSMMDSVIEMTEKISKLDSIEKANSESVLASQDNVNKASVFLEGSDSTIHLTSNMRLDHRIFGYSKPDKVSERLLLLSVFTDDVENNPFACKLGSYYDTSGNMELILKYVSTSGDFVKALAIDENNDSTTIYFEKKWIEFDN